MDKLHEDYLKSYFQIQSLLILENTDITEADIMKSVKKASSDCATKITTMDNLKIKLANSNKQYLEMYKDKAKQVNPTGLYLSEYRYSNIDAVQKHSSRVFEMIKKKEKEAMSIDNIPDLKKWIDENITQNGIYNEIFSLLYSNPEGNRDISVFIKQEKKHQITKSDIIRSIKNLESCESSIGDIEKFYKDLDIDYRAKLDSYDRGIISGTLDSNMEEYYQTVEANCIALSRIASNEIYRIYMKLYKINQKTDRVILKKAANYNPMNIKESADIQEQINIEYNLSFYTD